VKFLTIENAGKATFVLILGILAGAYVFVIWLALDKAGR
jgi:hypothetical protein